MKFLYAVPLTGVLALSACSGGQTSVAPEDAASTEAAAAEPSPEPTDADGVRILRPGAPGEEAEEGPTELPETQPNDADVEFMTMMIPHHRQALVMADLARTRAEDPAVRRLASRIRAAQAPEIQFMGRWLTTHDQPVPAPEDDTVDGGSHGEHMGMLSADELAELVDVDGAEFDRLFLDGMMGHHQGAIEMSEDVSTEGVDVRVNELAADINVGQTAEIRRMEDILDRL